MRGIGSNKWQSKRITNSVHVRHFYRPVFRAGKLNGRGERVFFLHLDRLYDLPARKKISFRRSGMTKPPLISPYHDELDLILETKIRKATPLNNIIAFGTSDLLVIFH